MPLWDENAGSGLLIGQKPPPPHDSFGSLSGAAAHLQLMHVRVVECTAEEAITNEKPWFLRIASKGCVLQSGESSRRRTSVGVKTSALHENESPLPLPSTHTHACFLFPLLFFLALPPSLIQPISSASTPPRAPARFSILAAHGLSGAVNGLLLAAARASASTQFHPRAEGPQTSSVQHRIAG